MTKALALAVLVAALCLAQIPAAAFQNPPNNPAVEEPLPDAIIFAGVSADPNGGVADVSADVGGAKLVTSSTYLGIAAHVSKGTTPGARLSTKVQPHVAQFLGRFRGAALFWTAAGGLDVVAQQSPTSPAQMVTNFGYTVGSGPLVSIPLGKRKTYLQPHAEVTKGSMQNLGWRGGANLAWGSE